MRTTAPAAPAPATATATTATPTPPATTPPPTTTATETVKIPLPLLAFCETKEKEMAIRALRQPLRGLEHSAGQRNDLETLGSPSSIAHEELGRAADLKRSVRWDCGGVF